jgi:hypothetical protein
MPDSSKPPGRARHAQSLLTLIADGEGPLVAHAGEHEQRSLDATARRLLRVLASR